MIRIETGGWKWRLRERDVVEPWFKDYRLLAESAAVKKNPVRKVFRAGKYFIKLDEPEKLFHKCRAFLRPKSKVEFDAAMLLERASVPVVKCLGWGRCGCSGMLITEAFPNAVTVNEYWFNSFVRGTADKTVFLYGLTAFLAALFNSNFYHPDLHLGNILYDPAGNCFALVDVYGVRKCRCLSRKQRFTMGRVITNLKSGLTDSEAAEIIIATGLSGKAEADETWLSLLRRNAGMVRTEWPRRRRQILNGYSKYVTAVDRDGIKFILRHNNTWKPDMSIDALEAAAHFELLSLPEAEAEELWANSFLFDFLGATHISPAAMRVDGINARTLFFPRLELRTASPERLREFARRCRAAGVDPGEENNISMTENGYPICRSIRAIRLV